MQVQLLPDALTARWSTGSRTPAPQAGRMGSIPIRATWPSGGMADTRRSERRAFTAWEFDSPLGHCGVDWSLVPSTVSYAVRRRFKSGLRNWIAPMVKRKIIPRFERGVPGSNPGRGADSPVVQRTSFWVRSVLLGEQAVSKAARRSSNLCAPASSRCRTIEKGGGAVDCLMLVRI